MQMDELTDITDYIQEYAGDNAEVIFGHGVDSTLGEHIRVTVIATGFGEVNDNGEYISKSEDKDTKLFDLESDRQISLFDENRHRPKDDLMFDTEGDDDEEEVSYEFGWLKKEIKREVEEEDRKELEEREFRFDFESREEEEEIDEDEVIINDAFEDIPPSKKKELAEQRAAREEQYEGKKYEMPSDEFKERLDVPAYERKKIQLTKVPHSSESNISKFNLTDDNQILGNNKFLHDNVD